MVLTKQEIFAEVEKVLEHIWIIAPYTCHKFFREEIEDMIAEDCRENMVKQPSKRMIFLSYLEGMRESYQTVNDHGIDTLKNKISNLEEELDNPTINDSKNPLRLVQGYKILPSHSSTGSAKT